MQVEPKYAVIMAGGKGTRLKPYTTVWPKPLVPIGDRSILEILLIQLCKQGFNRVIICLNHMADYIVAMFGNGEKIKEKCNSSAFSITYTFEERPMGTLGALSLVLDQWKDEFPKDILVINGDTLVDLDFNEMLRYHTAAANHLTVGVGEREHKIDFGVINRELYNAAWMINSFEEKPIIKFLVAMGINVISREIIYKLIEGSSGLYGLDTLLKDMLSNEYSRSATGYYLHKGFWLDIGRPEDLQIANDLLEKGELPV